MQVNQTVTESRRIPRHSVRTVHWASNPDHALAMLIKLWAPKEWQ